MFLFALLCVCVCACAQEEDTQFRRIIGGEAANISYFPHAAYLYHKAADKNGHNTYSTVCGSVIITTRLVITAAHCLNHNTVEIRIFVGQSWHNMGQKYEIEKLKMHQKYNPRGFTNDIGIMLTKAAIRFGISVKPAIVSKTYTSFEIATIAGWGSTQISRHATYSDTLLYLPVPFIPSEKCGELLGLEMQGKICAGYGLSYTTTAVGDSGSGLIVQGKIVVGLLNGDYHDSNPIDIYANVTYHYDWIQSKAKKFGVDFGI